MKCYSSFEGKYITLHYLLNEDGRMGFLILPAGCQAEFMGKGYFDSLAHICLEGDAFDTGFANGVTMRNSETTASLKFVSQQVINKDRCSRILTTLSGNGVEAVHEADFFPEERAVTVRTSVRNLRQEAVTVQMLSSFSMGGLTPFSSGEENSSLRIHRLASFWSAEGRAVSQTPAELDLEMSWAKHGYRCMRFGQLGSHPVKSWFPFLAVEDTSRSVTWAGLLCGASSWQMELTRRQEEFCISGGLADEDFGHFSKRLAPGEALSSPDALVTAACGSYDAACRSLVSYMNHTLPAGPEPEKDLPVIFNEYCTTWGNPNLDNVKAIADRIAGHGMKYFMIDAGWYVRPDGSWDTDIGDWQVSEHVFPGGIRKATDYIRERGMIPGIWFELENVGPTSRTGQNENWLLHRSGHVIRAGDRRMLDMENPEVIRHLDDTVLALLKEGNFGYIKIDYNESIGVGCDGYESLGEGLRRKILATQAYFRHLKEEIPGLVIENCASGGHRLVPSMFAVSDMSSFSDAHECPEIPVIAANTALVMPARHNQIWAVLRKEDSDRRLIYSLSAAMLGRMCLSGDVHNLSQEQWDIIDEAIAFYSRISFVLQDSDQYIYRCGLNEYRQLSGWQIVRRERDNCQLLVIHNFTGSSHIEAELPELEGHSLVSSFGIGKADISYADHHLVIENRPEFSGCALLFSK